MTLARPRAASLHDPGALADTDRGSAATLPAQVLIGVPARQRCSAGSLPRRSLKVKARRRVHVLPLAKYRGARAFCLPFSPPPSPRAPPPPGKRGAGAASLVFPPAQGGGGFFSPPFGAAGGGGAPPAQKGGQKTRP